MDPNALYRAFNEARKTGDLEGALKYMDQLISARPQDPRMHMMRGLVLEDLQRPEDAIVSLRRALQLNPDYAEAGVAADLASTP